MLNWHDWIHIAVGAIEAFSLLTKFSLKLKLKLNMKAAKKEAEKEQEYKKFLEWKKNNEK